MKKLITTKQRIAMVKANQQAARDEHLLTLYAHTLAGYHANVGANQKRLDTIAREALTAAEEALKAWEAR